MNHCDSCAELATHSVTDAIQFNEGGWTESEPRFGCAKHPVSVRIITDERTYTLAEWEVKV